MDDSAATGWSGGEVTFRETQKFGQPVEHNGLELGHGGRTDPVETGPGKSSAVELAQDGRVGCRAREEGVEVWVLPVGYPRENLGFDVLLDVGPGFSVDGGLGGQELAEVSWRDLRDYLSGSDIVVVGYDL